MTCGRLLLRRQMEQSVKNMLYSLVIQNQTSSTGVLTACAGDFGDVPLAVGPAAYSGAESLDEALFTVITQQGVDLVARLHGPKDTSVLHHRGLPA